MSDIAGGIILGVGVLFVARIALSMFFEWADSMAYKRSLKKHRKKGE